MINAAVFDLDGLIFNTEDVFIEATSRFLRPFGYDYQPEVQRRMMGQQAAVSTAILKEYYSLDESVDEIRHQIEEYFNQVLPKILGLMPGFPELIAFITEERIPSAVCTSSTSDYAAELLRRFEFLDCFEFILGGELVENGKPAPDCYHMACNRIGFSPDEVVVFEDSENGCRAAVDAGTIAIAVPGVHNAGHTYSGAALIADTLKDQRIYELLRKLRKMEK